MPDWDAQLVVDEELALVLLNDQFPELPVPTLCPLALECECVRGMQRTLS